RARARAAIAVACNWLITPSIPCIAAMLFPWMIFYAAEITSLSIR
ncbi:hypothetical protein LTSEADE_1762, partial [Salmonella enterica subsp. enterica serovar Adelaide str. A4-669]